ncbi:MAG: asparagine synthase C-terminal domain-containing protein, partial [Cyclobacteriaceae bacterium]|nr:asparagine synthase C-terminal domain-containing protein [Cyclobacteriaceae bacterium]
KGLSLSPEERYWRWASFINEKQALNLLTKEMREKLAMEEYTRVKSTYLDPVRNNPTLNGVLATDIQLVLPNDMLVKADRMSMANSLEVRVPFLDHSLVEYAMSLPDHYKIKGKYRKRILYDAFREDLPPSLYNRPKKGFEVPLLQWLRSAMRTRIENELMEDNIIHDQGIFEVKKIRQLRKSLFSHASGDIQARAWGMVVFQWWWKKWFL